jgi:histidine triad (HIT) family protein
MSTLECVFCKIAAGDRSGSPVVFEDEHSLSIVDMRQPSRGHVLVLPRRHIRNLYELDDDVAGPLMRTLVRVSRAVRTAFPCDGMSHWISTDRGAGQEVYHLHIHIMPRHADDGLLRIYPSRPPYPSVEERERQAAAIRDALTN